MFSANIKRPLIMGILNATPDSFSGDGLLTGDDPVTAAVMLAARMIEQGADILDVGGESSRPGAEPVSNTEEIRRVVPVIAALKKRWEAVRISIDTVKADVAEAACESGASIINDISALAHDPAMADIAAKHKAWLVLMHNRSDVKAVVHDVLIGGQYQAPGCRDIIEDVKRDLAAAITLAKNAGVAGDKIILDPGIGFGKTVGQNLTLINHLGQIKALGYPVLIGPSRKSFIGRVLDTPVDERREGTAAATASAILRGADIVRVHDVPFMSRVARMAVAIRDA